MAQDQDFKDKDPREVIIAKAVKDQEFRTRLLANPKATVEAELGLVFPEGHELDVVENTASKTTLILPMESDELSVESLDQVAGGWCYGISWYGIGDGQWVVSPVAGTPDREGSDLDGTERRAPACGRPRPRTWN